MTIERDPYATVVAMSAEAARKFFGVAESVRVEDGGPPIRPDKYKPGARAWRVYLSEQPKPAVVGLKEGQRRDIAEEIYGDLCRRADVGHVLRDIRFDDVEAYDKIIDAWVKIIEKVESPR